MDPTEIQNFELVPRKLIINGVVLHCAMCSIVQCFVSSQYCIFQLQIHIHIHINKKYHDSCWCGVGKWSCTLLDEWFMSWFAWLGWRPPLFPLKQIHAKLILSLQALHLYFKVLFLRVEFITIHMIKLRHSPLTLAVLAQMCG
jgi:hypothetical protein